MSAVARPSVSIGNMVLRDQTKDKGKGKGEFGGTSEAPIRGAGEG